MAQERETEWVAENPRTFAQRCEQAAVDSLAPFSARAERIMHRLEEWLDNRSPIGSSASSRELDPARGEQFVSDLAEGMLTKELIENAYPRYRSARSSDVHGARKEPTG